MLLGWGSMKRHLSTVVAATLLIAPLLGSCVTGAIGIRECRELETERCQSAFECGKIDDVGACQRYVRDHCLHGIAGPKVPTRAEQDACLDVIIDAGKCAKQDDSMPAEDCTGLSEEALIPNEDKRAARSVCDLIMRPWDFEPCAFLNEAEGGGGGEEN